MACRAPFTPPGWREGIPSRLSSLEQMVESGVDLTLVAVAANTVKVLEAVERIEAGPPGGTPHQ
jgi:hypothetical protein